MTAQFDVIMQILWARSELTPKTILERVSGQFLAEWLECIEFGGDKVEFKPKAGFWEGCCGVPTAVVI